MQAVVGASGVIPGAYVSPARRIASSQISCKVTFRLSNGIFWGKFEVLAVERRKEDKFGILGGSLIEAANQSRQLFAPELQNGTFVNRRSRRICRAPQAIAAEAGGSDAQEFVPPPKKFMGVEPITLKKVIPLGMMFFCIIFNYMILRDTNDALVVTAKGSSAEIIPFLKTLGS